MRATSTFPGRDAILDAVLRCYRCLWDPRAGATTARSAGSGTSTKRWASSLWKTVPAQASGVAFTLNPVTGEPDEVVINASWGLGEAIVSGSTSTPDTFITAKDGHIRAKQVSEKHEWSTPVPGGTERVEMPPDLVHAPSLTDDQVAEVVATATAVERAYGTPVDVEFAYSGAGKLFLLQARPITTR